MISLQKKFLFIHVPKTGGNSIQNVLRNFSEDKIVCLADHQDGFERFEVRSDRYNVKKHFTLDQYKNVIKQKIYQELFKFSTIRNPWDRCVSFYFSPSRGKIDWDRENFRIFIHTIRTIRYFTCQSNLFEKINRKLGVKLLGKPKPLDVDVDFLMRFENLNEDFRAVCEKIDIPYEKLPHRNKSSRSHYTKYYDDELIELVRNRFMDEIEFADYEYNNPEQYFV